MTKSLIIFSWKSQIDSINNAALVITEAIRGGLRKKLSRTRL